VVITDFWNFGMPLIRYNIGDQAIAATEECNCGRGLPLMGSVEGRTSDFLTAADGTQIHGEFFTHLFYDEPSVSQFQLIQESMSKVTIKVVPATSRTSVNLDQIVSKTKRVLGGDLQVSVELHDTIPATPSGKFRFTISKLNN
jgi:phenylacetate-CoA ligase